MTGPVLLAATGITAGYGPQAVIRDVSLEVRRGEVVCLLGPNGAGKTTTMLTLAGELTPSAGTISYDGRPLGGPLHRRARHGLSYVTEERSVLMGLTVRQNLRLAGIGASAVTAAFPELEPLLGRPAGQLSGGEQQILTLGRALARGPRLLLADELSLGLAPMVVRRLLSAVRSAADNDGTGVLIVEQHARKALEFADRVYVLRHGRVTMSTTAEDAYARMAEIEDAYLTAGTASTR